MSHSPHPDGSAPSPASPRVALPRASRAIDELPTLPGTHPSSSARPLRWTRTLRGRLTLSYAALLAILLLVLGVVLNVLFSRVLYNEEFDAFLGDAKATVALDQRDFDALVNGHGATCTDALSYQAAFQQSIATHLATSHAGVQAVYLLDRAGNVLAPETGAIPVGTPGPYLERVRLAQLRAAVLAAGDRQETGYIADVSYSMAGHAGQRTGVVLIAERYHTASTCVDQANTAVGIIEVVTTFPRVAGLLDALHLLLLFSMLAVFVVGLVIGGPLTTRSLRPLTHMSQAARRIASGDLSQRVRLPHSGDEIGQLAATFDEMAGRIEAAFAAQQASEERMRQFIADASHELRTPLTSIRGYTDVLLRGAKDDPATVEQVLLATRREAERMSRLVADLLTLARLDVGRPLEMRQINLIALVGEAVDQARILAGEREVAMRTDGGGRLLISADADRLKQVLLILLDNALKYGRPTPDGWVRVGVARTPHGAIVTVSDNGVGISPENLPHIFDRFYRVRAGRRRGEAHPTSPPPTPARGGERADQDNSARRTSPPDGSGLGLSIAQAIVRAHGGSLTVQSQPGTGTTFTLILPTAPDAPTRP